MATTDHPDADVVRARETWRDPALDPATRVEALLAAMTTEEKLAQLGSTWRRPPDHDDADPVAPGGGTGDVAPMASAFAAVQDWEEVRVRGIGHLTRVYGTAPVEPLDGRDELAGLQRDLLEHGRLGVPAIAHEECLTGVATLRAANVPTPLAMAATFDPVLIAEVGATIGSDLSAMGVHQALSPVLDVVVDPRWGRTEETFGEDPYLVGCMAAAYVGGLESQGIVATLKHFAGHAASRAARNHAPVSMGPREFADVHLLPFEHGLRLGGARSVMNSYADVDGVPPAADPTLLTDLLRDDWGFTGTVVSDYGSLGFLVSMHRVAPDLATAAAQALHAGIDVELPESHGYDRPLLDALDRGDVDVATLDRAVRRVLHQKLDLGLLDADWAPTSTGTLDLDHPRLRDLARRVARSGIVLLANDGVLPLLDPGPAHRAPARIALVGPGVDDPATFLGCYSFANHVLPHHPEYGLGIEVASLLDALAGLAAGPDGADDLELVHARGCAVRDDVEDGPSTDTTDPDVELADAVELAAGADVAVVVLADLPGMFGRGTTGEGNDAGDLHLPGRQAELATRVLDTGTPTVLVVVSGRPYALGGFAERAAATVQAFLPGAEGGTALAEVLLGHVEPGGRLPIQVPTDGDGQPAGYRHPMLGEVGLGVSSADVVPAFPFGHGLGWTTFEVGPATLSHDQLATDGRVVVSCDVTNTGDRDGTHVVQLYLDDPVGQVARPVRELLGFTRVALGPGATARVDFDLHADRLAYTGRDLERIVEPGEVRLAVGSSSADLGPAATLQVTGPVRAVGHHRELVTPVTTTPR